jgi:membrane fusion protein, multidrug efflux system
MAQESRGERAVAPAANDRPASEERPAATPGRRSRWLPILVSVILIGGALFITWRWYEGQRRFVSTDDAMIDADRLTLSSRMLGRVILLTVDEGDTVNSGQILIRLDASDLHAQQRQAQAGLDVARANVQLAKITMDRTRDDLARAKMQFESQTITQEQYDHARQDNDAAAARLAVAEAQIAISEAQIAVLDTSLTNTAISSPMHGVISRRWVLQGDVVQPGQAIFSIYNLDSVWVTANLEETKLGQIAIGDPVDIHVDAYPDHEFSGRVAQVGTNTAAQFSLIPPNNASGNFTKVTQRVPVRMALSDDAAHQQIARLLPGMSVTVKVRKGGF